MIIKNGLAAPSGFWELSKENKKRICNGCGKKGLGGWFVPDTLWGLNVTEECNAHDYMYETGKTNEDKMIADRTFRNNMLRKVSRHSRWLRPLRRIRVNTYFTFVDKYGGPAFWDGKNNS